MGQKGKVLAKRAESSNHGENRFSRERFDNEYLTFLIPTYIVQRYSNHEADGDTETLFSGRTTANVVPSPTALVTSIRPW